MLGGRRFRTRSRYASKDPCHTQVLVNIEPVNALTVTEQLPPRALRGGRMEQPGKTKPGERSHGALGQRHPQLILRDLNLLNSGICLSDRRTHAKPPRISAGFCFTIPSTGLSSCAESSQVFGPVARKYGAARGCGRPSWPPPDCGPRNKASPVADFNA
jgi:hypothetical protein